MGSLKISNITNLSGNLSVISSCLNKNDLTVSDILGITDNLDEIAKSCSKVQKKANSVFINQATKELEKTCHDLFERVQVAEHLRLKDDEKMLQEIYELSYQTDLLGMKFFELTNSDIEDILSVFDQKIEEILKERPYNEDLIEPKLLSLMTKLANLHFENDFPIVLELNENNKSSYAHNIQKQINNTTDPEEKKALSLKLKQLQGLLALAKTYLYGSLKKADCMFDSLDVSIQDKIKENLWTCFGKTIKGLENKEQFIAGSIIEYIKGEIRN